MRVSVLSRSTEVLSALSECQEMDVASSTLETSFPEADLYIWDFSSGFDFSLPKSTPPFAQHLVLCDREDLDRLTAAGLGDSVYTLLKPVTPFTVRAFAELAHSNWKMRNEANQAHSLRLDRDALLQYALEVNLKLQEYDQDRCNFLARALHEFRTPLTALHGYCGLLAEEKLGPVSKTQRELLTRMRYSTKRLTRLTRGMLDLVMGGQFRQPLGRLSGDIQQTVTQALHDVHAYLTEKHIEVKVNLEPPQGKLAYESEQIEQVLINLLENSSKFTPKYGTVEITGYSVCATAGGCAGYRVDVADSGPGVPEALVEKIFEQFASYAGSSDRSGEGLGLAICKGIIQAHAGRIWATPAASGGRFSFTLPFEGSVAAQVMRPTEPELETASCV